MRKISTFVLSLFTIATVAQTNGSDPQAKKILDEVSSKFKTYSAVKADFALQIENAAGKVQGIKKGTAYMKSNQYKIEITDQEIISNGSKIWTYDIPSNEVQVSAPDPSGNGFTPQKVFTNFYDKDFLYKLNGEKKEGQKTLQEIELTPTDKGKNFFKILVYVDKAAKNVASTKIFEKNGNRYTYKVNAFVPNPKLDANFFVFDPAKHPGIEVVDLQ